MAFYTPAALDHEEGVNQIDGCTSCVRWLDDSAESGTCLIIDDDVKALVLASSSTVYGGPEVVPMPEDHPKRPVSIYGASKLACKVLVETYHRLYGLKGPHPQVR